MDYCKMYIFYGTRFSSRNLTLDFDCQEEQSFPVMWAVAHFLSSLWQIRVAKKAIKLIKIRSEMEAICRLLRHSRLENTSEYLTLIFTELLIWITYLIKNMKERKKNY